MDLDAAPSTSLRVSVSPQLKPLVYGAGVEMVSVGAQDLAGSSAPGDAAGAVAISAAVQPPEHD
eukprot:5662002-Alexandrium_andersonii.AAC.1